MNLSGRTLKIPGYAIACATALFAFIFCWICGRRGFHPLDQSIVFDGAWRIIQGQVPYRDFICPLGPLSFLYQALVFCIFGTGFQSYVLGAAILNALATMAVWLLLRSLFPENIFSALAGAMLTAVFFYPPVGTTYPDQTSVFFCLLSLTGLVFALRKGGFWLDRKSARIIAGSGFLLGLALLTKQNFALFFFPLPALIVFLSGKKDIGPVLKGLGVFFAGTAAALLLFIAWLFAFSDPGRFLRCFFIVPLGEGLRRFGGESFGFNYKIDAFAAALVILACGTCIYALFKKGIFPGSAEWGSVPQAMALYVAAYMFLMLKTTNNNTVTGLGLIGLVAGLGIGVFTNLKTGKWPRMLLLFVFPVLMAAVLERGTRASWTRKAHDFPESASFETMTFPETIQGLQWGNPTPAGLIGGKYYVIKKHHVEDLLRYLILTDSRFFVFPDFTALYAFAGKTSPQPLLWFHKGLSFPSEYDPELDMWLVESLKKNRIDTIIFEEAAWFGSYIMLGDFPGFQKYMNSNFEKRGRSGIYNIYKIKERKKE